MKIKVSLRILMMILKWVMVMRVVDCFGDVISGYGSINSHTDLQQNDLK